MRRAAANTRRADQRLVASARALHRCEAQHHGSGSCKALRRAVQRAGSHLAAAKVQLARVVNATSSGSPSTASPAVASLASTSVSPLAPPVLWVSGQTVYWNAVPGVQAFVLATMVPGKQTTYKVVWGTSVTPPPVPGVTVSYNLRTINDGSRWGTPVSIAYPVEHAVVANPQAAPTVTVSGQALSWNTVAGVNTYVLARKVTGHSWEYSVVNGETTTPPAAPGATVYYSVRTAVEGSEWAREVTITYPAETKPPIEPEKEKAKEVPTETSGEAFVKGINANMQGWGTGVIPEIASEMSTLGVNWAREDLAWSEVEPQRGVFNWSTFDQVVTAARAHGVTILPVLGYAPSWTNPYDSAAYGEFVAKAVERYGPGTASNLKWWELWNEPNDSYAWSNGTPSAEGYARDVVAAAEAAKRVNSQVKVIAAAEYNDSPQTGGTTAWQTSWVNDMFTAEPNLAKWIDGVSVHPYIDDPSLPLASSTSWKDAAGQWAFQRIDIIHSQFEAHGAKLPFWITEDGWSTRNVSEAEQNKFYGDLIQQIALRPWVRALFPYCLREFSSNPTNDQSEYGLLKFGSWQPKAAFYTLKSGLTTLH